MIYFTCVSAVRTVAAGHKMQKDGLFLRRQWIRLGQGTCHNSCSQSGQWPHHHQQQHHHQQHWWTWLEWHPDHLQWRIRGESGEDPIFMEVGGKYQYGCPRCDKVTTSKHGCDAHICQVHTGKALMCAYCRFSMHNMDSLNRHMRGHN